MPQIGIADKITLDSVLTKINELLRRMTPTEIRRLISPAGTGTGYTSKSISGVSTDENNYYKANYPDVTLTYRTNGSNKTLTQNTWNSSLKYTGTKYALVNISWLGFTAYDSGATWEGYVTYTDPDTSQTVTTPTSTGSGQNVVWDNPIFIPAGATNIIFYVRCTSEDVDLPYGGGNYAGSPLFSANNDGDANTYFPMTHCQFKQLNGTIQYNFNLSKYSEDIFDFNWWALLRADWSTGTSTDANPVKLEIGVDTSDTSTPNWVIAGTGLPAKNTVERISNRTQTFTGNGTQTQFTITNTFMSLPIYRVATVFIDGVEMLSGYYFDQPTSKITFDSPPANGTQILVVFDLGPGRYPSIYIKVYLNAKSPSETPPTFNLLEVGYEVE